jgi:hypothetical protein
MCPVVQDTRLPPDDEERRLLAVSEECHAKELAAADELANPRRSMLYPTYRRLADALGVVRRECIEKWRTLRAYRKKRQDQAGQDLVK